MPQLMDRPVTLPNDRELEECDEAITRAVELLLGVRWRVNYLGNCDDAERPGRSAGDYVPTFEDIGRLFSWFKLFEAGTRELSDAFDGLQTAALENLDFVRSAEATRHA
jgi:hypothetical protein